MTGVIWGSLWFVSRNTTAPMAQGSTKLLTPFSRMAVWFYRKVYGRIQISSVNVRVLRDLQILYPDVTQEQLLESYFVQKLGVALAVIFTGTALAGAVWLQGLRSAELDQGSQLYRGEFPEDSKEISLQASAQGLGEAEITLNLQSRLPTKDKADKLETEFWEALCKVVLGGNPSFQQVSEDLVLQEQLEGYPFVVEWYTADPRTVSDTGMITAVDLDESQSTVLTAVISYDKWQWQHDQEITVMPDVSTAEEAFVLGLTEEVEVLEAVDRGEGILQLPTVWQGIPIVWQEKSEHSEYLLWGIAVVAAVGIFFFRDRDLHAEVEKREDILRREYPFIVNKLLLYMGAGLNVRGVFYKMAEDYRKMDEAGVNSPAYQEIQRMCRELDTGVSETAAYEEFGVRCGLQEYIRLMALLSQNLKKGNSTLLMQLREEMEAALREKMNQCRRAGEEASTKLLIPMVMILGIIMVIIMVPAFGSF